MKIPKLVSTFVLLSFAFIVGGAAPYAEGYGALAIDSDDGDQYGWAVNYPSQSAADARARAECGSDCYVAMRFSECAAYATGGGAYGYWYAADGTTARNGALRECQDRSGGMCVVRVWGCNSTY
jgi:hypothetical protein